MNKKVLFTFPLAVSCLALFACNDGKVSKLNATVPSTNVYKRGGTISKSDFSVYAELSGGGQKEVKSNEWTSDKFGSSDTYTFTTSGENVIDVKYGGQTSNVKITVNPKGSTEFTFKDLDPAKPLEIEPDKEKTVEIKMNEEGAEADVSKVEWSINTSLEEPDSIEITPDKTNQYKCVIKGKKEGKTTATVDVTVTDTVGNNKKNSLLVDVKSADPEYTKYLEFAIIGFTENVSVGKKSTGTLPSELTIPSTVDGKYVTGGTAGATYTVTEVAFDGFKNDSDLTKVVLPNTITKLNTNAFNNCSNLSTVTLNEGLIEIWGNAFQSCGSLTSITLPETLRKITSRAFDSTGITSIKIPGNVESIGDHAFGSDKLNSATFDDISTGWTISTAPTATEWTPDSDASINATKLNENNAYTFTKKNPKKVSLAFDGSGYFSEFATLTSRKYVYEIVIDDDPETNPAWPYGVDQFCLGYGNNNIPLYSREVYYKPKNEEETKLEEGTDYTYKDGLITFANQYKTVGDTLTFEVNIAGTYNNARAMAGEKTGNNI